MSNLSALHSTFVIERAFSVPPSKVFRAWASADVKKAWMKCDDAMITEEMTLDFRPGGQETNRVMAPDGTVHRFEGYYLDIVENARIIYAFNMYLSEKRISTSLATVEFQPSATGSKMVFTEQIVFLDGYEDRQDRIRGTEIGLDNLVAYLRVGGH
ncbi:hypothetical protein LT85_1384 [Collimonas arenae]|uniref:Activator of Hsp90 ATPase homologue 1/2-like C-terminal domain-containing protein n=1 Tax=Collimonas arenae TaxID=279058 RepID=A0A0A1FCG0_9BURK|nr:SRPBCC family protein [Collimonas arenae]AIY40542.1 hypothetical protein LT85_1384 [Collimonas arenae]